MRIAPIYRLLAVLLVSLFVQDNFAWPVVAREGPSTDTRQVSRIPTLDEVLTLPDASFAKMTSQNKPVVLGIARRLALRADPDIAARIPAIRQGEATFNALNLLAQNTDDPGDLAFFQRFFGDIDKILKGESPEPYVIDYMKLKDGLPPGSKRDGLLGTAGTAMRAYAVTAHRLGMDDAALPALFRKLDHVDYDVASMAAQALGELQSPAIVSAIGPRLRAAEEAFPRGPWDPKVIEKLQEFGGQDTRFGKASLYLSILTRMKPAEAQAAAEAALQRWEEIYKDHPQRDEYLGWMNVPSLRDALARTAAEMASSASPAHPQDRDPANIAPVPTPPATQKPAVAPTTAGADDKPAWVWISAGVAALALLAGLLVFWKRRG